MKVWINGEEHRLDDHATVATAVSAAAPSHPRHLAVAVNGEVIPRAQWDERTLAEGDRVEVVAAIQGG